MEIDKKMMLTSGVFGGIGLWIVASFLGGGILTNIVKGLGALVFVGGVIYFVVTSSSKKYEYSKDIDAQLKEGNIDLAEAYKLEKQKLEIELDRQKLALNIEKQKLGLAKAKAKMDKIAQTSDKTLGGMPDILGNISGLLGSNNPKKSKKKDKDNDLKNLF